MMAERKADQERRKADRKSDREELKGKMNASQERMAANLKDLKKDTKSGQAETRSIICAFRSEFDETTACQDATETEAIPGMMHCIEEHQEFPKKDVSVMPVEGPRKRRRVQNLAAERRQKMKERPRDIVNPGGSRLPPAGSCPAVEKWNGEKETP
jgi:hypothetical protein